MVNFGELFEETISRKQIGKDEVVTFLGMQDVSEDARVIQQHLVHFSEIRSGFTYFEKNDVLLAKITPCFENGKGALLDDLKTPIGFGSTEFHVLRARKNVDPRYVFHWTCTNTFRQRLEREMVGSAGHRRVPISEIRNYQLPIKHNETEQIEIANALSDADALIGSLQKLIAKKRQIKQGAMQTLLNPYESGVLKAGWAIKELGEIADVLTGHPFPSNGYAKSGIRLLRGSNIKRGVIDWSDEISQYWPSLTTDIRKYVLEKGDIVIAMDGSLVGKSFAQISENDLPAILLQRVARIRTKSPNVDVNYIKEWICSEIFTSHCDSLKTVTAIPHISPGDIRSFKINMPFDLFDQKRIASILSDMDAEIAVLETKLTKYQQIKQGMMQNLLTGRIRLV